ncbi:hypothetical protein BC332_34937 [Capsicum chinense]|nr:hypothetical protein BC332_34937 [Capsicum chinense]
MLVDDDEQIRRKAVNLIIKARKIHPKDQIRNFSVPKLNFKAGAYHRMINWKGTKVTPPPLLNHLSNTDLRRLVTSDERRYEPFPCHTQAVERGVKLVTDAAIKVYGAEARDGYIRAKVFARGLGQSTHRSAEPRAGPSTSQ